MKGKGSKRSKQSTTAKTATDLAIKNNEKKRLHQVNKERYEAFRLMYSKEDDPDHLNVSEAYARHRALTKALEKDKKVYYQHILKRHFISDPQVKFHSFMLLMLLKFIIKCYHYNNNYLFIIFITLLLFS